MAGLCDLVEILEKNMESVVLEEKDRVQKELVCLGCFDGDETMLRLTKGDDHTCTIFFGAGKSCSWSWGMSGHTLVSDSLKKCGRMIESCITEDFGIYVGADTEKRKKTLHIRSLGDTRGCREEYRLLWWENREEIVIHRDGEYLTRINGLENAKEYMFQKINVESVSDMYKSPNTGCCVIDINGRRK